MKLRDGWTLFVDTRGMEPLSKDSYDEINRVREEGNVNKIRKSAVVVDNLVNMIKTASTLHEIEKPFEENYFNNVKEAIEYLEK